MEHQGAQYLILQNLESLESRYRCLLTELLDYTGLHKPIYTAVFVPLASPANASLLWALTFTGLMFGVAWLLWRKKIILRA